MRQARLFFFLVNVMVYDHDLGTFILDSIAINHFDFLLNILGKQGS